MPRSCEGWVRMERKGNDEEEVRVSVKKVLLQCCKVRETARPETAAPNKGRSSPSTPPSLLNFLYPTFSSSSESHLSCPVLNPFEKSLPCTIIADCVLLVDLLRESGPCLLLLLRLAFLFLFFLFFFISLDPAHVHPSAYYIGRIMI